MAVPTRILVTGASGFVGTHLVEALNLRFPDAEIITPLFDVAHADEVGDVVRSSMPDACVHLAAIAAIPAARQAPNLAWQVNLTGTLALANALQECVPQCLLLFTSSSDAYGASFRSGRMLDEQALLSPLNVYAATKAAADLALGAMAANGLRVVRVRPFNHIGPGQSEAFVVASFARQIARIEAGLQPPVLQVGALDAQRDFLDVRDVCTAYALILERAVSIPTGTILNIASGIPRRVGDILDDLCRIAGIDAAIEVEPGRLRPTDIPTATGDATLARSLLGWKSAVPWKQTLRDILDDWRHRALTGTVA